MNAPRLITIGFSHFCEKARWALDRTEIDYIEDDHVPFFHVRATRRAGSRRTVPALKVEGKVLSESSDIVRFADEALPAERRLFPAEAALRAEVEGLVAEFDRSLGPAARRAAYFCLLKDTSGARALLASTGPTWERRLCYPLFPAMRVVMKRAMNITPESAARSRDRLDTTFAEVSERLSDGRRFLVGDRFSAADLTFAALAAPMLLPPQYGHPLPPPSEMPPDLAKLVGRLRDTPAGRFALRMYAEERPRVRGRSRRSTAS
jgi:glutathione S-transferase